MIRGCVQESWVQEFPLWTYVSCPQKLYDGSMLRIVTACIIGYRESSRYHSCETNLDIMGRPGLTGGEPDSSAGVSSPPHKENIVMVMRICSAALGTYSITRRTGIP
jgi:hypothetical protein